MGHRLCQTLYVNRFEVLSFTIDLFLLEATLSTPGYPCPKNTAMIQQSYDYLPEALELNSKAGISEIGPTCI